MKNSIYTLALSLLLSGNIFAQQDKEGCKDSPMFPNRIKNYILNDCISNYDASTFILSTDGLTTIQKEGTKTFTRYDFNAESGQTKPSTLQILKNYENAAKNIGAVTIAQNSEAGFGTYKIMKNGKESIWIKVECGGDNGNDFYEVTIIQMEAMEQEITSASILTALNTDGHLALYINFETGKSNIKSESQNIIDQIAEMLKANPTLKINIEGHTDNVGTPAANLILSDNRAKSVMNALVAKGIDKTRLTAKGLGQSKPIADNTIEEGKGKNRRVEIVKL